MVQTVSFEFGGGNPINPTQLALALRLRPRPTFTFVQKPASVKAVNLPEREGRGIMYSDDLEQATAVVAAGLVTCAAIIYFNPAVIQTGMVGQPLAYLYHANSGNPADSLAEAIEFLGVPARKLSCVYAFPEASAETYQSYIDNLVWRGIRDEEMVVVNSVNVGSFGIQSYGGLCW